MSIIKTADSLPIPVIAIDGVSASGKGTIASLVAKKLGFNYINGGAIYRSVAYCATQKKIAPNKDNEEAVVGLIKNMSLSFSGNNIFLDDEEVSEQIMTESNGIITAQIATLPSLREVIKEILWSFRVSPGLVAEGRDTASVVFTDAMLKIFLTANVEVRAERRVQQLQEKGVVAYYDDVLMSLKKRDHADMTRSIAPLVMTPGSILLDNSEKTISEAVDFILERWCHVIKMDKYNMITSP